MRALNRGAFAGQRVADFLAARFKLRARPLGAGGVSSLARGGGLGVQCLAAALRVDEPLRIMHHQCEFRRVRARLLARA